MPEAARSREGPAQMESRMAAWRAYRVLSRRERQTTAEPPRPTIDGRPIAPEDLARWRGILDQAGAQ